MEEFYFKQIHFGGEVKSLSRTLMLLGVLLLVVVFAMMFVSQFAFATTDSESASTAPQTGTADGTSGGSTSAPGQPIDLCGVPMTYMNSAGSIGVWDRNNDGVMDAWDVNNDGIVDRWDPDVSCARVTTSRLPITGAPTMALIAVATAMMGAGLVLRRSSR